MFLGASKSTLILSIVIPIVIVQYAFAVFCLLKLAYLDLSKRDYVLWNLFILIVFFIGGGVFLGYYYTHPEKRIRIDDFGVTADNENSETAGAEQTAAVDEPESDDGIDESRSEQDGEEQ